MLLATPSGHVVSRCQVQVELMPFDGWTKALCRSSFAVPRVFVLRHVCMPCQITFLFQHTYTSTFTYYVHRWMYHASTYQLRHPQLGIRWNQKYFTTCQGNCALCLWKLIRDQSKLVLLQIFRRSRVVSKKPCLVESHVYDLHVGDHNYLEGGHVFQSIAFNFFDTL